MHHQRLSNSSFNRPQQYMQHFRANIIRHNPEQCGAIRSRNENHWCETCDRGFRTFDMLKSHKQQHQICKIDGCQFIAHPKVITIHIQMQHSSGLYKKIGNLTNPEDIKKWREERKKKYPTKENVLKKSAELKEKIERGEKMGLKKDKKKNDGAHKRKHLDGFENYNDKRKKLSVFTKSKNNKKNKEHLVLPLPENLRKLKPFAGIVDLANDHDTMVVQEEYHNCNYEIEDDDDDRNNVPKLKMENTYHKKEEPQIKVCGALTSLMCEYGSSDEEVDTTVHKSQPNYEKDSNHFTIDNNTNNQTKSNQIRNLLKQEVEKNNVSTVFSKFVNSNSIKIQHKIENDDDDDCPPEEVKVEKAVASETDGKGESRQNEKNKKRKNNDVKRTYKKQNIKLPSTLLQKLLHKEIRQERNIVLQCIRHIVNNDYFDK